MTNTETSNLHKLAEINLVLAPAGILPGDFTFTTYTLNGGADLTHVIFPLAGSESLFTPDVIASLGLISVETKITTSR
jgi:hypothetical protein